MPSDVNLNSFGRGQRSATLAILVIMSESRKGSIADAMSSGDGRKGSTASGGGGGGGRSSRMPDRKGSVAPPKGLDLDDVLVNELGQFGRYQLYNICLVAFPIIASAFINEYIFSAAAIPHRLVDSYLSHL